jgi:hypothetical protein
VWDIWTTSNPFVIGASCDIGDFPRTEDPWYGRGVMDRLLGHYYGPLWVFGPTVGTWTYANETLAITTTEETFADPWRPVAVACTEAQRRADAQYDGDDRAQLTVHSYVVLGDVKSHVVWDYGIPTDVARSVSPLRFGMGQSFPNPFRDRTTVAFTTTQLQHVQLSVFNVAGRLVRTLVRGDVDPGSHRIVWDGRSDAGLRAANGVYFVDLQTREGNAQHKLVLLK